MMLRGRGVNDVMMMMGRWILSGVDIDGDDRGDSDDGCSGVREC